MCARMNVRTARVTLQCVSSAFFVTIIALAQSYQYGDIRWPQCEGHRALWRSHHHHRLLLCRNMSATHRINYNHRPTEASD